jgi:hypothetical protein
MKKQTRSNKAQVDSPLVRSLSSHDELMADMREFKGGHCQPSAALDFLKRAGLVSAKGKPKQLIRV